MLVFSCLGGALHHVYSPSSEKEKRGTGRLITSAQSQNSVKQNWEVPGAHVSRLNSGVLVLGKEEKTGWVNS